MAVKFFAAVEEAELDEETDLDNFRADFLDELGCGGGGSAGADMSADAGANASTGTARTGADSDTSANPTLDTDVASTADATAEGDTLLTGNQAQAGALIGLDVPEGSFDGRCLDLDPGKGNPCGAVSE